MANTTKMYQIIVVAIMLLYINVIVAQRPSFAGSRPTNGLNQKDKYHSTTPSNTDIQNRFGSGDVPTISIQIPFGQTQKPPVGYAIVYPESIYTALAPSNPSSSGNDNTGVTFQDRFGEGNINSSTVSSSNSSPASPTTTPQPGVPLDAHGDQLLIDQLNSLPIDKRPFWFINYQAIEAQRNGTSPNFAGAQGARGSFFG